MSCEPQEPRTQETKRPRVGPRTQVPLAGRVPVLSSRNRASPTSVLADEKVMPEKKPILVLAEEKEILDETRRRRHRSRSPPPPSFFAGYPADGPESGIATAGEHVDKVSNKAEEEPYITSTKNPFALLGELKDAEAATEAADSLDKISGWPEGGIASAGKASNDFPRLALALTLPLEVDQRR